MRESLTPEKSAEQKPYREELVRNLDISGREIDVLTEMFQTYAKGKNASFDDEHLVVRTIRHFLHDRKAEIKAEFAYSVLGQSGCFAFSVKSCLLADNLGIKSSLARSTRTRALHVMLVDKDGEPYDVRELSKGDIKPMSIEQVRAYGNYLQPIVAAVSALRSQGQSTKHVSRFENVTPIIPCNDEVQEG